MRTSDLVAIERVEPRDPRLPTRHHSIVGLNNIQAALNNPSERGDDPPCVVAPHAPLQRAVDTAQTHNDAAGAVSHSSQWAMQDPFVFAELPAAHPVGVFPSSLLASAGVAGIALGLAAQNIVRDLLNGVLILVEDQFNVGDTVRLAGLAGTVEAMTLRKTTVRDIDGTVYVIPNSQITTVANLSVGYSVATVNVSVDFSANPDRVLELLKTIAAEIRESDKFKDLFVADPQILGVDAIRGSELIFSVVFKTLPTEQYAPVREFRRRVRLALEEQGLLPGDPNRIFNTFMDKVAGGRSRGAKVVAPKQDPTTIKPQEGNPFGGGSAS